MSSSNRLNRVVAKINGLPKAFRSSALSFAIGRVIPFAGTASTKIVSLTHTECIIVMRNKRKVQNHIGSVHAAAIALLAESATGLITGMNVPDNRILVIRNMELEYIRRATGDMTATARFTDSELEHIRTTDKGDIAVPVVITDSTGTETVKARMIWAWTPKKQ